MWHGSAVSDLFSMATYSALSPSSPLVTSSISFLLASLILVIPYMSPSYPVMSFSHSFHILFFLLSLTLPPISNCLCSFYTSSSSFSAPFHICYMLTCRNSQISHMLISGSSYFTTLINFHEEEVAITRVLLQLEGVGCVLQWIIDGVSLPLSLMKAGSCSSCWNTTIGCEESRLEKEDARVLCMEG